MRVRCIRHVAAGAAERLGIDRICRSRILKRRERKIAA
jgi:hypothetical protein